MGAARWWRAVAAAAYRARPSLTCVYLFRQALAAWHAAGRRAATAQALFGLGLVYQVLHSDWTSAIGGTQSRPSPLKR